MNFEKLNEAVASAQLGSARVTDMVPGTYTVKLNPDDHERVQLVNSDTNIPYTMGIRSFAGMRIVQSEADAKTLSTTKDARESDKVSNLKTAVVAENGIKLDGSTKFAVVHRVMVYDSVADGVVYKNDNYKGYPEYVRASRIAAAMPSRNDEEIAARNLAFSEAGDSLRQSGIKVKSDDHALLMPIFTVTS